MCRCSLLRPMTKITHTSDVSSPSTTVSTWLETLRSNLVPVPETCGALAGLLAPVMIRVPLPEGFVDIDALVDESASSASH